MNSDPALYSQHCRLQITDATNVLNKTRLSKSSYPNVLDIGCGTGEVTNIICEKIPGIQQLIAFDKLQEMVDFAEVHNPNDRIRYKMADITIPETLPRDWTGRFNLVTSFTVLHWVKDQTIALKDINRIMAPGAEFLFYIPCDVHDISEMSNQITESPRWRPYLRDFIQPPWAIPPQRDVHNSWRQDPVNEYSKLIRNVGLEVISAEAPLVTYTFPNEEEIKGIVTSVLPQMIHIPEEEQPDFAADTLNLYKSLCPHTEDGNLQSRYICLNIHGRKPLRLTDRHSAGPDLFVEKDES